ncbi:hypothetical protein HU200_067841 [Digitaria exilis]|uniref:Uncharacterized protein n=1 Tax=Digitaria exilis TaxID=1010633 RepID=A0A834ZV00_9POAL|nr:hypothetical protein HU200_067841 [Digitaria exilis]
MCQRQQLADADGLGMSAWRARARSFAHLRHTRRHIHPPVLPKGRYAIDDGAPRLVRRLLWGRRSWRESSTNKEANVAHGAAAVGGAKSSTFLYGLLLYVVLPVLVLYFVVIARLPPEGNVVMAASHFMVAAKPNNVSLAGRSLNASSSPPPSPTHPSKPALTAEEAPTGLRHIVFGIGARKEYIKLWWRPGRMRGLVWMDRPVQEFYSKSSRTGLPAIMVSSDTSKFPYTHGAGSRRSGWASPASGGFVMGDDDTVFLPENLVHVLSRYDHRQPYYIGSPSESHIQNLIFSYGMAFGGGGFAISRALAEELAKMQDGCLHRYPRCTAATTGSTRACRSSGVTCGATCWAYWRPPRGAAGDAAPPRLPRAGFPATTSRAGALRRLFDGPVRLDSAAVAQQSVCYDRGHQWTVSVSWGFAVMVVRGVLSPREMETPMRSFLNWYKRADYTAYSFNTRPVARQPCQKPHVYYMRGSRMDRRRNVTHPACRWRIDDPGALLDSVVVLKKPDPDLWKRVRNVVYAPGIGSFVTVGNCDDTKKKKPGPGRDWLTLRCVSSPKKGKGRDDDPSDGGLAGGGAEEELAAGRKMGPVRAPSRRIGLVRSAWHDHRGDSIVCIRAPMSWPFHVIDPSARKHIPSAPESRLGEVDPANPPLLARHVPPSDDSYTTPEVWEKAQGLLPVATSTDARVVRQRSRGFFPSVADGIVPQDRAPSCPMADQAEWLSAPCFTDGN